MELDNVQNDAVFFAEHALTEEMVNDVIRISKELLKDGEDLSVELEDRLLSDLISKINTLCEIINKYMNMQLLLYPYVGSLTVGVFDMLKDFVILPQSAKGSIITNSGCQRGIPCIVLEYLSFHLYTVGKCIGSDRLLLHAPNNLDLLVPVTQTIELVQEKTIETFDIAITKYEDRRWCLEYILLEWLSLLIYVPFELKTIWNDESIMLHNRIMNVAKYYLNKTTKARDGAASVISNIFSRSDVLNSPNREFESFLEYCNIVLTKPYEYDTGANNYHLQVGMLAVLKQILKRLSRSDILKHTDIIESSLMGYECPSSNAESRKLRASCLGRLATHLLPPGNIYQAYRKKCKKLLSPETVECAYVASDYEFNVDERIENIVARLLESLLDKDIRVRWASAKAIGLTSAKLPLELNEQILDHIIDSVNEQYDKTGFSLKSEGTVHGCCLAIAEIIRNGILHPNMLDKVLACTSLTLSFDVWRGKGSAGTSVRDASCYICWAIARNFTNNMLKHNHIITLSRELVNVTLFDSSINCRRAASSALQELVGRQNNVPCGLDLIVTANYYSIANRKRSFINVAYEISHLGFYNLSIITNLLQTKLYHPDIFTRELSAIAIGNLAFSTFIFTGNYNSNVSIIQNDIPPHVQLMCLFIKNVQSPTLGVMHGSLRGLTYVLSYVLKHSIPLDDIIYEIIDIPVNFEKKRLFRGKGGNIIREAICKLINIVCRLVVARPNFVIERRILDIYIVVLKDCIRNFAIDVQIAATESLEQLFITLTIYKLEYMQLKDFLMNSLKARNDHASAYRGYALSLSTVPAHILDQITLQQILLLLCDVISRNREDESIRDAQTRQFCLLSIITLMDKAKDVSIDVDTTKRILSTIISSCNDYETDSRGDVGSWIREVSSEIVVYILSHYFKGKCNIFSNINFRMATDINKALIGLIFENLEHTRARSTFLFSFLFSDMENFEFKIEWIWNRIFYGISYEGNIYNGVLNKHILINEVLEHYFTNISTNTDKHFLEGIDVFDAISTSLVEKITKLYVVDEINFKKSDDQIDLLLRMKTQKMNVALRLPGWSVAPLTFEVLLWILLIPEYTSIATSSIVKIIGSNSTNEVKLENMETPLVLENVFMNFINEHKNRYMLWNNRQMTLENVLMECILNDYQFMIDSHDYNGSCKHTNTVRILSSHKFMTEGGWNDIILLILKESKKATNYSYLKSIIKCLQTLYTNTTSDVSNKIMDTLLWFLTHKYPTLRTYVSSALMLILTVGDKNYDEAIDIIGSCAFDIEDISHITNIVEKLKIIMS